ncbi:hypothetical protein V2J09_014133 [Rumex salicifolius]
MAAVSPAGANSTTDATVPSASTFTATPTPAVASSPAAPYAAASPVSPAVYSAAGSPSSSAAASPASAPAVNKPSPLPTITLQRSEPPKNLRGLNKPKCIKCGNVARSRCPYQSCKSCCSKAQNPCHIHVLKPNATLADRSPSSNTSHSEQQAIEASSSGPSNRPASIRQLSSSFAQFNNVHIPLRSRKPLTRKDAITINEWRFSRLKEFRDRNIEAENEAFDRYMQNISLLEEVFNLEATTPMENGLPVVDSVDKTNLLSGNKAMLRSDPVRSNKFRKRIQNVVEQGLVKRKKHGEKDSNDDLNDGAEHDLAQKKTMILDDSKASLLSQLNDKINKARNEDDLSQCLQIMSHLSGHLKGTSEAGTPSTDNSEVQITEHSLPGQAPDYSLQKLVNTTLISQEALNKLDLHFSSLEEIEDL